MSLFKVVDFPKLYMGKWYINPYDNGLMSPILESPKDWGNSWGQRALLGRFPGCGEMGGFLATMWPQAETQGWNMLKCCDLGMSVRQSWTTLNHSYYHKTENIWYMLGMVYCFFCEHHLTMGKHDDQPSDWLEYPIFRQTHMVSVVIANSFFSPLPSLWPGLFTG